MQKNSTEEKAMKQLGFLESDSHSSFNREQQPSPNDQAYFASRATLLLGSYRKDNATNPDVYVQAITMVLSDYPRNVVELATDPRTGIQADDRYVSFAPNAGEVRSFCEEKMRWLNRRDASQPLHIQKRAYVSPRNDQGCWAQAWIAKGAPQYAVALQAIEDPSVDPREWKHEERGGLVGIAISYRLHLAVKNGGRVSSFLGGIR